MKQFFLPHLGASSIPGLHHILRISYHMLLCAWDLSSIYINEVIIITFYNNNYKVLYKQNKRYFPLLIWNIKPMLKKNMRYSSKIMQFIYIIPVRLHCRCNCLHFCSELRSWLESEFAAVRAPDGGYLSHNHA